MATVAVPPNMNANQKNLWATLQAYLTSEELEAVRSAVERTTTGWSGFFATLGNKDLIQRFAAFIKFLKLTGMDVLSINNLVLLFRIIFRPGSRVEAAMFLTLVGRNGSQVNKIMGLAAKHGARVAVLTMFLNSASHISRGTWGPAAAEMFKFAVGNNMPLLGIVDAVEQLVTEYWPDAKGNPAWKYIRALNILGMAGVGVDSAVTVIQSLVDMAVDRRIDPAKFEATMRALDARIRSSPASAFSEIGDNLSKAFDQMSRMTPQQIVGDLWTGFVYTVRGGR